MENVHPAWIVLLLALVGGYLCGTIPFGLFFARLFKTGDIRKIGSGNIGATNALRTGNKAMAACVLLGDVLKATVPVLIAFHWGEVAAAFAGFGAFVGHCFPVWLRFKGGKGVATYLGVLFGIAPIGVPVFAVVWLSIAYLMRFSSLAALLATLVVPLFYAVLGYQVPAVLTALLTLIVWVRHRGNIQRLIAGTEGRIGTKS